MLLGVLLFASPAAAAAGGSGPTTSGAAPSRPRAWILVDADRGTVLDAGDDRVPLPPASLTKLLTALIAVTRLQPSDTLTVSARAAGEPASKINMQVGQTWKFQDALYALLLSSANDAAVAIAERVGGGLDQFAATMQQAAQQMGLQDGPVLEDPAGLDDNFSVDGGNRLSARDIAIIARGVLAQPLLAQVVSTPVYRFLGPDGVEHRLTNHNTLLRTYPGAIGMKTGYTAKSGEDLVAAAQRGGRTMIAVVMGAPNLWVDAADLLDEGFASPATASGTGDVLPPIRLPGTPAAAPRARVAAAGPLHPVTLIPIRHGRGGSLTGPLLVGLAMSVGAVLVRRRQIAVRRRRRQRLARGGLAARR